MNIPQEDNNTVATSTQSWLATLGLFDDGISWGPNVVSTLDLTHFGAKPDVTDQRGKNLVMIS